MAFPIIPNSNKIIPNEANRSQARSCASSNTVENISTLLLHRAGTDGIMVAMVTFTGSQGMVSL